MSSMANNESIAELAALRERLVDQVGKPHQLPEPARTLNYYTDRLSSEVRMFKYLQQMRMFKYLQQMCLLHRENFLSGNKVQLLYLIDGFLTLATAQNPIALYGLARSMLKLSAFLHEVQKRLHDISHQINENRWQPLGEKYFGPGSA
jgi:hypothetical protein